MSQESDATAESFASTPTPPYTAVIFTSTLGDDVADYPAMSARMRELVARQPGYIGMESAREAVGITVSYWVDDAAARGWKHVLEHLGAQQLGRDRFYSRYRVRVATVQRDYSGPERSRHPTA